MKTNILKILLTAVLVGGSVLQSQGENVSSSVSLQDKTYTNSFVANGISSEKVDARLAALWKTYFEGNKDSERLYYKYGADEAYIKDINNNDIRSEGMSYGMMICVQMNKQKEFDRLWKWVKTRMQITKGDQKGYIGWKINDDGSNLSDMTAPDGDEYMIMALMFADARWGSSRDGIFNYWKEANEMLDNSLSKSCITRSSVTDMFDTTRQQVVFVPYASSAMFTDPSYHLPAFYQLWSLWAENNRLVWAQLAKTSRSMFSRFANATTGLMPDYANFDGSPTGSDHQDFRYDAWRCSMNMAMDYAWFRGDETELTLINRLLTFFNKEGVSKHGSEYSLSGKCLNTDHSAGLVACNATAASVSDLACAPLFIKEFWNKSIPTGKYRYYDGMLYFLNFLALSGNYRIYTPQGAKADAQDFTPFYTADKQLVVADFDKIENCHADMQHASSSKAVCEKSKDPINAANNVLAVTPGDWDEYVMLRVNLPEGRTLGKDYSQLDFDILYDKNGDNANQDLKVCIGSTDNLVYKESTGSKSAHGTWHHVTVKNADVTMSANPFRLYIGIRTRDAKFYLDNVRLKPTYDVTTGIGHDISSQRIAKIQYFNIKGQTLPHPCKGVNIVKRTYDDGKTETMKYLMK